MSNKVTIMVTGLLITGRQMRKEKVIVATQQTLDFNGRLDSNQYFNETEHPVVLTTTPF